MVMQVKRATFQRMESGGKGRTENRRDVSDAGHCTTGSISYISTVSISRVSVADRRSDDRSVPSDTAECCSVSEISI